ncbi:hypothetical protein D3C81_1252640 [compost metagenome]
MAVDAVQVQRAIRECRIQVGDGRERGVVPAVLVPAGTQQPLARRQVLLERLQPRDHFGTAARTGKVRLRQCVTQVDQMRMRVDQARHHRGLARIDARCIGIELQHGLGAADIQQPAAVGIPGQSTCHGLGGIAGTDGIGHQHPHFGMGRAQLQTGKQQGKTGDTTHCRHS